MAEESLITAKDAAQVNRDIMLNTKADAVATDTTSAWSPNSVLKGVLKVLGFQADTAATTDTGTFSLNALFKRHLEKMSDANRNSQFSAFDEHIGVGIIPSNQHTFGLEYHDAEHFSKIETASGTITFENSQVKAMTAAGAGSLAKYFTKKRLRYRAGQGIVSRFTILHNVGTGAAGVLEFVGLTNGEDTIGIGFLDTDYGLIHITASGAQIAITSITQAAGTATVTTTAAHGLSTNDLVSIRNTAQDGYILPSRVTVTGASTFTYLVAAATVSPATAFSGKSIYCVKCEATCSALSTWDDQLNGSGASGATLDKTKGNVWQIKIPFLGYGSYSVEYLYNGRFHSVFMKDYENLNTKPSLSNPSMSSVIYCENITNATSRWVKCASLFGGLTGSTTIDLGVRKSARATKSGITTEVAVLTVRNNRTFQGRVNNGRLKLKSISISSEGTGTNVVELYLKKNATLGGSPSYAEVEAGVSSASFDTATTTVTGAVAYPSLSVARGNKDLITFDDADPVYLEPEETLTLSGSSASSIAITAVLNWIELKD
jgi:hypothetical protein